MTSPTKSSYDVAAKAARAATDPNGPTGQLATWLANTTLDDVPVSVREHAKHLLLDGVACALVGAQLPVSRKGVEAITTLDDAGSAQLIGWDGLARAPHRRRCSTRASSRGSSSTITTRWRRCTATRWSSPRCSPPRRTWARCRGRSSCSARSSATRRPTRGPGATRSGNDLPRLALGRRLRHPLRRRGRRRPLWIDAAGFEDALGMAATQSCGLMSAQFESMVKRMQHGFASRAGLTAAALAASGYVGIKRVFEREYGGWLPVFGEGHHPNASEISAGLGTVWETARIAVKAYAAMGLLHAGIDAALKLRSEKFRSTKSSTSRSTCAEGPYQHGGWQAVRPLEPIGAQMNIAYVVAVALLDGQRADRPVRGRRINRDDVWRSDRPHPNPPRRVLRQTPGRRAAQNQSPSYARRRRRPRKRPSPTPEGPATIC